MNVGLAWLADFVDLAESANEVRDIITARVATVDAVERLREDLRPIVVARVVECARHPDSDRLSVTKVDAGTGELLDVVCGAPNVRAGKLYPFARVGTTMPGGLRIERRKIRGAVSSGMLCSPDELGLGTDHDGILELDVDVAPGTPFLDAMPSIGDARLVVDVLPNRPDLLSHLGVAREVAAAVGRPLTSERAALGHVPSVSAPLLIERAERAGATGGVRVSIDDVDGCPRYLGVRVRNIRVGPSPEWLVRRLESIGTRSINNIVDVTNFMLHGFGQPMHAFDASKLAGPAIVVRRAVTGEKLVTLDGVERVLSADMCVIADAERAQALAGVMGGRDSEVTEATTDVLLEVAAFNPRRVRQMRRALSISSEASYRFERGTDGAAAHVRLREAVALITALAGGEADPAIDVNPVLLESRPLILRATRIRQVLGESVPPASVVKLLRSVGFGAEVRPGTEMLTGSEEFIVAPPSWRNDVHAEIDLIEEVARLHGYDAFPSGLRPFRVGNVPDAPAYELETRLQDALAAEGLLEVRPLPFVRGADDTHVRLTNPIAENEGHLRRSLLETLVRRAEFNLTHMQGNVRLFEVGAVFEPSPAGPLPVERNAVGLLVMGERRPPHFTEPKPPRFDEWDAKGLAALVARTAYPSSTLDLRPSTGAAPGVLREVLWEIVVDDETRGRVGLAALDGPVWAAPAYVVELDLGRVDSENVADPGQHAHDSPPPPRRRTHAQYRPLPSTPSADVDLALVVPDAVHAADVERLIRRSGGELLEHVTLFDEFRGPGVPDGARSLAWRLTFRDATRTLRDKEVEGRTQRILRTLEGELGVRPRTI